MRSQTFVISSARSALVGRDARCLDQGGQQRVDLGERCPLVLVTLRGEQPSYVHRGDEVDDRVPAVRREATPLDAYPAFALDRAELVCVVLAVAAIVVGDAAHERVERQGRPFAPGERNRSGESGMVGLREHDRTSARAEHRRILHLEGRGRICG